MSPNFSDGIERLSITVVANRDNIRSHQEDGFLFAREQDIGRRRNTVKLPFEDGEICHGESGLALVRPNAALLESYREACAETWDHIHNRYILHDPQLFETWRHTIFQTFEDRYQGINLPKGYYPSVMLWAEREGTFIGAVNIRLQQDEMLLTYGGTYGYFVRVSQRGRGYGTALGLMGLEAAQRLGVNPIAITLQESNEASCALAEHLPYTRVERYEADVDGTIEPVRRYWLSE